MAFDLYNIESRTLTITCDDPWGAHVGYETKQIGTMPVRFGINNNRLAEIQSRIGFASDDRKGLFATFAALITIPETFALSGDDFFAWRFVKKEVGDAYHQEMGSFNRRLGSRGELPVEPADIKEIYGTLLPQISMRNEAAERIATWLELSGYVDVPTDFRVEQQKRFTEVSPEKESMWDYTGVQVW